MFINKCKQLVNLFLCQAGTRGLLEVLEAQDVDADNAHAREDDFDKERLSRQLA